MTVELDFVMEPDGDTLAVNYPSERGWEVDIYLKKLKVRKNSNIVNLAQKISRLYLLEYICAEMQKIHGGFNEETYCMVGVSRCVLDEVIKEMV